MYTWTLLTPVVFLLVKLFPIRYARAASLSYDCEFQWTNLGDVSLRGPTTRFFRCSASGFAISRPRKWHPSGVERVSRDRVPWMIESATSPSKS